MVKILEKPLTIEEIRAQKNSTNYVSGNIAISLGDAINNNADLFYNLLSEKLTGTDLLTDIQYRAVGFVDGSIIIEVWGGVSMILEMEIAHGAN